MNQSNSKISIILCAIFLTGSIVSCNSPPGLTVSGQFVDKDGEPIPSKQILMGNYHNFADLFHVFSTLAAGSKPSGGITDQEGYFEIEAKDPGKYLLLYRNVTDGGESTLHALTDTKGKVIVVELSEEEGANAGKTTVSAYPKLPKKYLPDFLSEIHLGTSLEDFEAQNRKLEKHDGDYIEIDPLQNVDQVVYGFNSDTRRLDKLEIWYAGDTDAYKFGEENFGIPNYQGPNVNDASVIHWQFTSGDGQVEVTASKGVLEFRLE